MATKQLLARFNGLTRRGFSHAEARAEARNGKGVKTPWRKEGTSPFTTAEAVAYYTPPALCQEDASHTPMVGAGSVQENTHKLRLRVPPKECHPMAGLASACVCRDEHVRPCSPPLPTC